MTNYEKYREELIEILTNGKGNSLAVVKGRPAECGEVVCEECEFYNRRTRTCQYEYQNTAKSWLNAEYVDPPKLTPGERHYCKALPQEALVSRVTDSNFIKITTPDGMAIPDLTIFNGVSFSFVKADEVWRVGDLLKLEVLDETDRC